MIDLNQYMIEVRKLTDAKGFSSDMAQFWRMIALIHTEISEAADAYKKGRDYDDIGTELVDALIRILHLCSALDIDVEKLYRAKMAKNWSRPYHYNTVRE